MAERRRETSRIGSSLGSPGSSPADSETTSSLDRAIDTVAREMTALDSPAGMRADVLARIEGAPRPGTALVPRWAWAVGLAVVVLAVSATVWFAGPGRRPESVTVRHDTSSMPAAGATQIQPEASGAVAGAGPVTAGTEPGPQPSGTLTSTALATNTRPVGDAGTAAGGAAAVQPDENATATPEMGPAALAQLNPIVIAAIGPDAIHVPDIGVEPLVDPKPITIQDIPVGAGEPQSPPIQKVGDQPVPPVRSAERAC